MELAPQMKRVLACYTDGAAEGALVGAGDGSAKGLWGVKSESKSKSILSIYRQRGPHKNCFSKLETNNFFVSNTMEFTGTTLGCYPDGDGEVA